MYNYGYGNSPYSYGRGVTPFGSTPNNVYSYANPGFVLAGATFLIIYFIALWIFKSVGFYHLAKERGIPHPWFAWIPFLDMYILGELINQKVVLGTDIITKHAEFFLPALCFVTSAVLGDGDYGWAGAILVAVTFIYRVSAYWRLYKIYRPKSRAAFTVWSVILGSGFFVFAIRNDKPFDELEPNKVYQDYYGQKHILEDNYQNIRSTIEQERNENLDTLHSEYEQRLDNEHLTDDSKKELRQEYHEIEKDIRESASQDLHAARDEYNDEVSVLEDEIKAQEDPIVSVSDNDVIITPIADVVSDLENPEISEKVPEEITTEEIFIEEPKENQIDPETIHETIEAINRFNEGNKE